MFFMSKRGRSLVVTLNQQFTEHGPIYQTSFPETRHLKPETAGFKGVPASFQLINYVSMDTQYEGTPESACVIRKIEEFILGLLMIR
jgi:hypothetical protein